jgi:hypothetical protein
LLMNNLDKILEFSLEQGKFYLEKAGEFYPFGSILKNNGELVPLGIDIGEEYPDSLKIIEILEENILQRIDNNEILAGAIGTDVYIKSRKTNDTISAIEVRAIDSQRKSSNIYLPYAKVNNELFFQEPIKENGTLTLK